MHPIHHSSLLLFITCSMLLSSIDGKMNQEMRDKFLTLHNNAREAVRKGLLRGQPAAIFMKPLKYNLELEEKAQILSDQCRVGHDTAAERNVSSFSYVGQNWAGAGNIEVGFNRWLNEYKGYDFITGKCRIRRCGHYTQVVWQRTTDVGCGVTACPDFPYALSIVCNYGPGGNYVGRHPYETAPGVITSKPLFNKLVQNTFTQRRSTTKQTTTAKQPDSKSSATTQKSKASTTRRLVFRLSSSLIGDQSQSVVAKTVSAVSGKYPSTRTSTSSPMTTQKYRSYASKP
uniref:SCP domain-containing protein n=1 Tax=Trichobilharzia regenti TaxID=157069 RepID=A0AA85J5A9_TRIRE|nr:unnamed protein product [Trichobilharzia regenti]